MGEEERFKFSKNSLIISSNQERSLAEPTNIKMVFLFWHSVQAKPAFFLIMPPVMPTQTNYEHFYVANT